MPRGLGSDDHVIVLSWSLFHDVLGGEGGSVGQQVRLAGQPFVVIGVAPREFLGLGASVGLQSDVWIPSSAFDEIFKAGQVSGTSRRVTVFTRPSSTDGNATTAALFQLFGQRLDLASPLEERDAGLVRARQRRWTSTSFSRAQESAHQVPIPVGTTITILLSLVTMCAATNLANLALGRGATRMREFAIKHALGASGARLVGEMCLESALLGILGGILAFAITFAVLRWTSLEIPLSAGRTMHVEARFTAAVALSISGAAVLAILVFGLWPAWRLVQDLRSTFVSTFPARVGRRRLITWQVAMSTVFLILAALCVSFLRAGQRHDSGIDTTRLVVGFIDFRRMVLTEARAREALDRVVAARAAQPGVESIALATGVPYGWTAPVSACAASDSSSLKPPACPHATYAIAGTDNLLPTLGIGLARGEVFRDDVNVSAIVVSERTARDVFGTTDVIGREIWVRGDHNASDRHTVYSSRIVGVSKDTDTASRGSRRQGTIYLPLSGHYEPRMFVLERQKDTVETTDIGLRAAVIKSDPDLAMTAVGPADRLLDPSNFGLRSGSVVGSLLGFGTMLLTITGLYGLTSEFVARRTPELAVRLAIGSTAVGIGGLVFRDALTPVFHGLVLGAFLALCGGVLLRSLIPGVTAIDWSLGAACGLFQVGIAAVACLLPVLRAMRVQPSAVLRAQ